MKARGKKFLKEWGISIITFALVISTFVGSAMYLKPYLVNATETTSEGIEIITTSNSNIKFSTYFVNEDGEKVNTLNSEIDKIAYLYVDVTVLNEGYFNGTITLNNSNFVFIEEVEKIEEVEETEIEAAEENAAEEVEETETVDVEVNEGVSEITENSITLDQINAGETVTIKVAVEAAVEETSTISLSNLSTETEVEMSGEYVNSKNIEKNKSEEITGTSEVKLQWRAPEEAEAKLKAELLTNSIYEIDGEEKRVVQIIVNSKISNNCYPVYTSLIKLAVPENVEKISVSSRNTDCTNSNIEFGAENYTYNEGERILEITLENKDTENINWNKSGLDTIVVTYVLDVNEYIEENSIDVNSVITTYDSKELTANTSVKLEQTESIEGIITYNIWTEDESIYKGKLYSGEDKEYSVTNEININYLNVVDSITLNCNEATYLAGTQEGSANIVYTQTKINKQEFISLFGEEGTLIIKDENGNEVTITNDTEADEEGYITISYEEETKSIEIITSEPKATGTLKIEHTKEIENTGYTRKTIEAMTEIKETITGYAKEKETGEVEKETENVDEATEELKITLNETSSSASLKIDTNSISTTAESQTITLCAILDSSDETKNLYKNPVVRIILPEEITVISAQYAVLYKNGLSVGDRSIKENENGQYVITIHLDGEQTSYDAAGGTRIYFKLEISTSTLTPTKVDEIQMAYTNEYTGEVNSTNAEISFESQYGLMIYNQLTNYSEDGEKLVTIDKETATGSIEEYSESKEVSVGTAIINNYGTEITDVSIIGSVPSGDSSTFVASLNSVVTDNANAQILYSTETNIDADDESWGEYTEDSVSYKIVIASMAAEEVVKLSVSSTIPADLNYNEEGYYTTTTLCTYNEKQEENTSTMLLATEVSDVILTKSTTTSGLDVEIAAYLGNISISEDDLVYEGETIRYEVTVTNNTGSDYTNVAIKAVQTNGYVWDEVETEVWNPSEDNYQFDPENMYYEHYYEKTESNEIDLGTIESLANGENYSFTYESSTYLLSNEEIDGTETYGTITFSDDVDLNESVETIKNEIEEAELEINLLYGNTSEYEINTGTAVKNTIEVNNLTDSDLNNIEIQVTFSSNLNPSVFLDSTNSDNVSVVDENNDSSDGISVVTINISKIEASGQEKIKLIPSTDESEEDCSVWTLAKATTEGGNTYISNKFTRNVYNATVYKDINIDQYGLYDDGTSINQELDYISDGENIEIVATISNNEEEEVEISINHILDQAFSINKVTLITDSKTTDITDEYYYYFLSNYTMTIGAKETIKIIVDGSVSAWNVETISSVLYLNDVNSTFNTSSEYIIKINTVSDEDDSETKDNDGETENNDGVIKDNDDKTRNNDDETEDNNGGTEDNGGETGNNETGNNETVDNGTENNETVGNEAGNNETINNETSNEEQGNSTENTTETHTISGIAWFDKDKDGVRDSSEETLSSIEVLAVNSDTQDIISSTNTSSSGVYSFELDEENYIIVFYYDNELYTTTTYQVNGAGETENSDAIESEISLNGETQTAGVTDTLSLTQDLTNIDIGLIERNIFDLDISKYVSKVTVTNDGGTKTYEQSEGTTLAKTEIKSKYINSSTVEIEYVIQITNSGDIAGYANTIVDNKPSSLDFDETLNSGWYQENGKLYYTGLANEKIEPGETKEITLVLTKTMTESNVGLINNTVQIKESSNSLELEDETNSTGSANVIVSISTGSVLKYGLIIITTLIILSGFAYIINRKIGKKG